MLRSTTLSPLLCAVDVFFLLCAPVPARHLFRADLAAQPAAAYGKAIIASVGPSVLDQAALTAIATCLAPAGELEVRELVWKSPTNATAPRAQELRNAQGLKRALLFAGFTVTTDDAAANAAIEDVSCAGVPPGRLLSTLYPDLAALASKGSAEAADALSSLATTLAPLLGVCVLRATKPAYKAGTAFSLRSRAPIANPAPLKPDPTAAAVVPPPASEPPKAASSVHGNPWANLGAPDGGAPAADLLDEDELLTPEDLAKKEAQQMDCGTEGPGGKRKACKNCSCGLKEMIEAEDGQMIEVPTQKSSCGNCALGDAYRCAGCPHLGKPAFVPGEELKLADSMMRGDAAMPTAAPDKGAAKVVGGGTGGVVKLSLDDTMDDF